MVKEFYNLLNSNIHYPLNKGLFLDPNFGPKLNWLVQYKFAITVFLRYHPLHFDVNLVLWFPW
jgi:hypothetical protein